MGSSMGKQTDNVSDDEEYNEKLPYNINNLDQNANQYVSIYKNITAEQYTDTIKCLTKLPESMDFTFIFCGGYPHDKALETKEKFAIPNTFKKYIIKASSSSSSSSIGDGGSSSNLAPVINTKTLNQNDAAAAAAPPSQQPKVADKMTNAWVIYSTNCIDINDTFLVLKRGNDTNLLNLVINLNDSNESKYKEPSSLKIVDDKFEKILNTTSIIKSDNVFLAKSGALGNNSIALDYVKNEKINIGATSNYIVSYEPSTLNRAIMHIENAFRAQNILAIYSYVKLNKDEINFCKAQLTKYSINTGVQFIETDNHYYTLYATNYRNKMLYFADSTIAIDSERVSEADFSISGEIVTPRHTMNGMSVGKFTKSSEMHDKCIEVYKKLPTLDWKIDNNFDCVYMILAASQVKVLVMLLMTNDEVLAARKFLIRFNMDNFYPDIKEKIKNSKILKLTEIKNHPNAHFISNFELNTASIYNDCLFKLVVNPDVTELTDEHLIINFDKDGLYKFKKSSLIQSSRLSPFNNIVVEFRQNHVLFMKKPKIIISPIDDFNEKKLLIFSVKSVDSDVLNRFVEQMIYKNLKVLVIVDNNSKTEIQQPHKKMKFKILNNASSFYMIGNNELFDNKSVTIDPEDPDLIKINFLENSATILINSTKLEYSETDEMSSNYTAAIWFKENEPKLPGINFIYMTSTSSTFIVEQTAKFTGGPINMLAMSLNGEAAIPVSINDKISTLTTAGDRDMCIVRAKNSPDFANFRNAAKNYLSNNYGTSTLCLVLILKSNALPSMDSLDPNYEKLIKLEGVNKGYVMYIGCGLFKDKIDTFDENALKFAYTNPSVHNSDVQFVLSLTKDMQTKVLDEGSSSSNKRSCYMVPLRSNGDQLTYLFGPKTSLNDVVEMTKSAVVVAPVPYMRIRSTTQTRNRSYPYQIFPDENNTKAVVTFEGIFSEMTQFLSALLVTNLAQKSAIFVIKLKDSVKFYNLSSMILYAFKGRFKTEEFFYQKTNDSDIHLIANQKMTHNNGTIVFSDNKIYIIDKNLNSANWPTSDIRETDAIVFKNYDDPNNTFLTLRLCDGKQRFDKAERLLNYSDAYAHRMFIGGGRAPFIKSKVAQFNLLNFHLLGNMEENEINNLMKLFATNSINRYIIFIVFLDRDYVKAEHIGQFKRNILVFGDKKHLVIKVDEKPNYLDVSVKYHFTPTNYIIFKFAIWTSKTEQFKNMPDYDFIIYDKNGKGDDETKSVKSLSKNVHLNRNSELLDNIMEIGYTDKTVYLAINEYLRKAHRSIIYTTPLPETLFKQINDFSKFQTVGKSKIVIVIDDYKSDGTSPSALLALRIYDAYRDKLECVILKTKQQIRLNDLNSKLNIKTTLFKMADFMAIFTGTKVKDMVYITPEPRKYELFYKFSPDGLVYSLNDTVQGQGFTFTDGNIKEHGGFETASHSVHYSGFDYSMTFYLPKKDKLIA